MFDSLATSPSSLGAAYQSLCSPAKLYLAISVITMLFLILQNLGARRGHKFCVGDYNSCFSATFANIFLFFFFKMLYIGAWTWILNYVCRTGNTTVSWILVLFPIILFFVLLTSLTFGPFFIYP